MSAEADTADDLREILVPDLGSPNIVAALQGRVLHLRIDRPERRNAFTQDMYRAIKRAAVWADGQPELDAVCLTGTGEWFGAGGDMAGRSNDPEGLAAEWDPTDQFPFRHLERCSKLWVAKVNGLCHAGGLVLTLHCDVTIASDRARFRAPELLRGIADTNYAQVLPRQIGPARARDMLMTGRTVTAAEAVDWGLVARVVPHEQLLDAAVEALQWCCRTAPEARWAVKRTFHEYYGHYDRMAMDRSLTGDEMVEGFRAFTERRSPAWVPEDLRLDGRA